MSKCNHMFEEVDYEEKKDIIDGCCSCHLNPPCGFCETEVSKCKKCGETEVN